MWYEVFLLLLQAGGRASSEAPLPSHLAELVARSSMRERGVFFGSSCEGGFGRSKRIRAFFPRMRGGSTERCLMLELRV
jgi:hypothetical protein